MKTIKLSQKRILEIIEKEPDMPCVVLALHKEVINIDWDTIESFNEYLQCNRNTAIFILNNCIDKFKDAWHVNSMWLQKGFSSNHNEVKDFEVCIPDNCYTLYVDSVKTASIEDFTGAYAQVEVEEIGEEPDYDGVGFSIEDRDPEKGIWNDNQSNNSYL